MRETAGGALPPPPRCVGRSTPVGRPVLRVSTLYKCSALGRGVPRWAFSAVAQACLVILGATVPEGRSPQSRRLHMWASSICRLSLETLALVGSPNHHPLTRHGFVRLASPIATPESLRHIPQDKQTQEAQQTKQTHYTRSVRRGWKACWGLLLLSLSLSLPLLLQFGLRGSSSRRHPR
jgi:hypothetical protein